jgi:hypothetical protein
MKSFYVYFQQLPKGSFSPKPIRHTIMAESREAVPNNQLAKDLYESGMDIVRIQEVKEATTKQVVAQAYGMIMGSIKGAKVQWNRARTNIILSAGVNAVKAERANNLVDMQFTKLERDLRDLFKLAGLKVK